MGTHGIIWSRCRTSHCSQHRWYWAFCREGQRTFSLHVLTSHVRVSTSMTYPHNLLSRRGCSSRGLAVGFPGSLLLAPHCLLQVVKRAIRDPGELAFFMDGIVSSVCSRSEVFVHIPAWIYLYLNSWPSSPWKFRSSNTTQDFQSNLNLK